MENQLRNPSEKPTPAQLRDFFISHLNRIYCAKSQLIDKLPQLGSRSYFLDLQQAINETVDNIRLQIGRIKEIYIAMDAFYQPQSCVGLIGILDEAFQSIGTPGENASLRDLSILFYMQNIESIEMASFKIMMRVAELLEQADIVQLLRECFDEAKEDKILFHAITENYLDG